MKSAKMLVLLGVAAIAAMACSATASATVLTDNNGNVLKEGATAKSANVGNVILDGTINVSCKKSILEGPLENPGSESTTVGGKSTAMTYEECGNNTVTVVEKGSVEIHTDEASANGNGLVTSSGLKTTILTHNIFGTVHCIYVTNNTLLGTLDGSKNTGGKATYTIDSVPIPRESTDFGCGETSEMTAEYQINSPSYVDID